MSTFDLTRRMAGRRVPDRTFQADGAGSIPVTRPRCEGLGRR